jgi:hypothetical protein
MELSSSCEANSCSVAQIPTETVLKNAVFWDVALCGSCVNQHSSEISSHTRSTQRDIPEDGIPHSRRRENLKSETVLLADGARTVQPVQ